MTTSVLKQILNKILTGEAITLTELATKAVLNRSNLSVIKNDKTNKEVDPLTFDKIRKAYPGYFEPTESNKNGARGTFSGQPGDLMQAIVQLMTTQNMILERQEKDMLERVKNIESEVGRVKEIESSLTQLSPVLAGVYSLSLKFDSARETVLKSLSRLEGKKEDHLKGEADKILVRKMHRLKTQGKLSGVDKDHMD